MYRWLASVMLCLCAAFACRADEATDRFNFATGLLIAGDAKQAAAAYAAAAAADTSGALVESALFGQAEALYQAGEWQAAGAAYAAFQKRFPKSTYAAQALNGQGWAAFKAGNYAVAEKSFATFLLQHPGHALFDECRLKRGDSLAHLQRYDEAAREYEAFLKACADHPRAADAGYKAGWACWQIEATARAGVFFQHVATAYPQSEWAPEAAFMAGRCAARTGDTAGATANFERAVALAPQSDAGLRAALESIHLDHQAGRYAEALAHAEAFLKVSSNVPAAAERRPFAWLYKGEALLELGRLQEALTAYAACLADGDATVVRAARTGQAWALRKLNKPAEAAAAFEVLAADDPSGESAFWAARSWDDAADAARAMDGYEKYLARKQTGPLADEAAYRRASALARTEGFAAAEPLFAKLVQERPESTFAAAALYDYAWSLQELKKGEAAAQRFDELIQRFPKHPLAGDAWFRMGELAYEKGAIARAAAAYETALAAGIAFADTVLYKLGRAREQLDNTDGARAAYQRLANDFPKSKLASEARYCEGRLLQAAAMYPEAVMAYAAVTQGAFLERAAFGRAECLRLNKQAQAAADAYRALLKNTSDDTIRIQAWLGLGHAYREAGANQDAIDAYGKVVQLTETIEAAQALLGQGYAWLAMGTFDEAAKAFLKVDILYGYDELKPEAVGMLVKTWEQAGDEEKAAKYRARLKK